MMVQRARVRWASGEQVKGYAKIALRPRAFGVVVGIVESTLAGKGT